MLDDWKKKLSGVPSVFLNIFIVCTFSSLYLTFTCDDSLGVSREVIVWPWERGELPSVSAVSSVSFPPPSRFWRELFPDDLFASELLFGI